MPRAALLSIHARVEGTGPSAWEDPSLVQLWGPRFSVFVVAGRDLAVFSLGTLPDHAKGRQRAEDLAARLHIALGGARMTHSEAGDAMGLDNANRLRYAAATGTVRSAGRARASRRSGACRRPSRPPRRPARARAPVPARLRARHSRAFGVWAGIGPRPGSAAFEALGTSLTPVRTPVGDAWILTRDEAAARAAPAEARGARPAAPQRRPLLPPAGQRSRPTGSRRRPAPALWTPRVWPGALLLAGEIAGTWRRADGVLTVQPWRQLSAAERYAVAAEAEHCRYRVSADPSRPLGRLSIQHLGARHGQPRAPS